MKTISNLQNKPVASDRSFKILLGSILFMICFSAYSKDYRVDLKESTIVWEAKKVTGQHSGTITFGESTLTVERKKITGGKLMVDMNTIANTDITNPGMSQKLIGHLKSDDFFGVEKFPQSFLVIKKVDYKAGKIVHFTADLTIKGITAPIEFDGEVEENSGIITASGVMVVNRAKYEIKYGSGSFFEGLGDKLIYDDFTLKYKLVAANK
jgi:polyisoprenoid-binding protein YceI